MLTFPWVPDNTVLQNQLYITRGTVLPQCPYWKDISVIGVGDQDRSEAGTYNLLQQRMFFSITCIQYLHSRPAHIVLLECHQQASSSRPCAARYTPLVGSPRFPFGD